MTRPAPSEETDCNLCGARDYEVVGRADRDGHPLQTVMCRCCGLVWTNPRPSVADMDGYYATEYRADYKGAHAPALRKVLRGMLGAQDRRRALRPLLRDGARLIDVGCGAGEFVYLLRRDHVDATGLEPGQEYADFARRILGIPVQTATVATAAVAPASQDVITMFHCLEHVPDPRGVLGSVRGWLKKGGLLVVEVPNVEATVQAPGHQFHYAHLHHFSGTTLGALGEAAGLRLVQTYFSDDGGNVTCMFRRLTDEERRPSGLQEHLARTRRILTGHTPVRHYLSLTPYRRAIGRLRRRRREDRLLQRLTSLDAILRWAAEPGPDHL
jgi:SAM-dependent methyltransferase